MRKPKLYYIFRNKKGSLKKRILFLFKLLLFVCVLCAAFYIKFSFVTIAILLAITYIVIKLIPTPIQESIEVYFDRLVYKSKRSQIELDFSKIAFIDQDVEEVKEGVPYYKSIEFLDESMKSLLFIDAQGYSYQDLVVLCNRIYEINQILLPEKQPTKEKIVNSVERNEISWDRIRDYTLYEQ